MTEKSQKKSLLVTVGIDVEEEGLFCGSYACRDLPVRNTASLYRLTPLLERGVKPVLFCAWSVFADSASRKVLEKLRDRHGAQIAAHLHHWNTPPFSLKGNMEIPAAVNDVSTAFLDEHLLAAKLDNLFRAAGDFQGSEVTTFRMGRWDMRHNMWPLLGERGILCDASVRPLHFSTNIKKMGNHFAAPPDPYYINAGGQEILEIPLTVIPLIPLLARLKPDGITALPCASLRHWGALAILPIYHPQWLMRLAASLHAARGGKVLSLTWHSSEMMLGGAPHVPDEKTINSFLGKMEEFLAWLEKTFYVTYVTADELRKHTYPQVAAVRPQTAADWTYCPTAQFAQ